MELEKSQTWKNLESALSQEAVAYCEYTFYGQQAAKDGYKQISDIFNETAGNELHHAKLHYKKMHGGKVPGTLDNLKAAAASEDEEVEIYTGYAKTAREEGFADLADFFEGLAAIEKSHENRYQLLIERIENDEVFRRKEVKVWVCTVCGHIEIGTEPPEKCPVCEHPQGRELLSSVRPDGTNGTPDAVAPTGACPSHSALSLTAPRPLGRASSELQAPVGASLTSLGQPVAIPFSPF